MLPRCCRTISTDEHSSTVIILPSVRVGCTLAFAVLFLSACSTERQAEMITSGATMGTQFNVTIVIPDASSSSNTPPDIATVFNSVSKQFSTYDPESELSKFNSHTSTEWFSTSLEFCTTLEDALTISRSTDGAFDVSVGQLVNLWGFGPTGSRTAPPPADDIRRARESTGFMKLHTRCEDRSVRKEHSALYVDLSGYAKGLAIDNVANLLDQQGFTDYLVELGGEIRVRGHNAEQRQWRIAVERPDEQQRTAQLALRVSDVAVATSGDYRNFFEYADERYSHTIDTRTGKPVTHNTTSVTVVDEHAAFADAMATALLVMGHTDGLEFAATNDIAAYFLLRDENTFRALMTAEFEVFLEPVQPL